MKNFLMGILTIGLLALSLPQTVFAYSQDECTRGTTGTLPARQCAPSKGASGGCGSVGPGWKQIGVCDKSYGEAAWSMFSEGTFGIVGSPSEDLVCCEQTEENSCVAGGSGACFPEGTCAEKDLVDSGLGCPKGSGSICCRKDAEHISDGPTVKQSASEILNAICFSQELCEDHPEYHGKWVPGDPCGNDLGKCLASVEPIKLNSPIGPLTTVTGGFTEYLFAIINYLLRVVVVIAAIMFVYGGFKYILASSPLQIKSGKEIIVNATIGVILSFSSILILRTINPATTQLNPLKIFMIKKQEFEKFDLCEDIVKPGTSEDKKALYKFAAAFTYTSRGQVKIPFGSVKEFSIALGNTRCGMDYYAEGTLGQVCKGNVCDTGKACVECGTGDGDAFADCLGSVGTRKCVKMEFGGNVIMKDDIEIDKIYLVPVCHWIQPAEDEKTKRTIVDKTNGVDANVLTDNAITADVGDVDKAVESAGTKKVIYHFNLAKLTEEIAKLKCPGDGNGLRGFVMAFSYRTTASLTGLSLGSIADVAIVTKQDCAAGSMINQYSGYSNGAFRDRRDIRDAMYCGYTRQKGNSDFVSDSHVFDNAEPYWSLTDVNEASAEKPVQCNIYISKNLTPVNPENAFYKTGGCQDVTLETEKNRETTAPPADSTPPLDIGPGF